MYVHLQFIENVLGALPNSKEVFSEFIGSKSPNAPKIEDEINAVGVDETVESRTTVFARTQDGLPFIYDYVLKGFFKEACGALQRLTEKADDGTKSKKIVNESGKLTAYKKVIDQLIFIQPRQIVIYNPDGTIGTCQRPLRAQTAQGDRVTLASSEEMPAGSSINFRIVSFSDAYLSAIREWLNYGFYKGLGQWRNSGKGRFIWEEILPFNIVEFNPAAIMRKDNIPEPVPVTELANTPVPAFANNEQIEETKSAPKKQPKTKKHEPEESVLEAPKTHPVIAKPIKPQAQPVMATPPEPQEQPGIETPKRGRKKKDL